MSTTVQPLARIGCPEHARLLEACPVCRLALIDVVNKSTDADPRVSGQVRVLGYEDLEALAVDLAKAIVEAHPDVLLWNKFGQQSFRDREFAEDALAEVIKRRVLAQSLEARKA